MIKSGDVFANWILSLPAAERPKTAAYAELDDPFSAPIAENIRTPFEAAGIKTVYKQVYPSETQDLSPIMAAVAAAKPDVIVGGTQSEDAYGQVKSAGPAEVQPEVHVHVQRRQLAGGVPEQGRRRQHRRASCRRPTGSPARRPPAALTFTAAYIAKYGGTARHDRQQQAEAYAAGQLLEDVASQDRQDRQRHHHRDAALRHAGRPCSATWPGTRTASRTGNFNLVQWQGGKLLPVLPGRPCQAHARSSPSRTGVADQRCMP